jgi:glycosyltransferase involved in cell wall biosynthesis
LEVSIPLAKLKLFQVITLSETGGAQKVLYHIVAGLSPAYFDVTVACAPGGELVKWLKELGWVMVVEVPQLCREISPMQDVTALWKLYRLIRKERFDIVHCHSSKAGILGRLAACLAGVRKIIFTVHGWGITPEQGWWERFVYLQAERLAGLVSTWVVCVSQADCDRGLEEKLAPASKFTVIYNGVPLPVDREKELLGNAVASSANKDLHYGNGRVFGREAGLWEGSLRSEFGLSREALVIGTVCRLIVQKAPLFFLEVARDLLSLPHFNKKLYFVLIGEGPLRRKCMDFIGQHGLQGRVFLLGNREDAVRLMADFDVFCLFSLWEGLPLTIIEAMFSAKPVVATRVGGVSELVVEGETGFLLAPGATETDKAVQLVDSLLKNPDLRKQMGEAGYRVARKNFSLEQMVERYKSLYTF